MIFQFHCTILNILNLIPFFKKSQSDISFLKPTGRRVGIYLKESFVVQYLHNCIETRVFVLNNHYHASSYFFIVQVFFFLKKYK